MPNYLVDPPPPSTHSATLMWRHSFLRNVSPLIRLIGSPLKSLLSVLNTLNFRLTNRPTSTKINPCMQVSDDNQQSHSSVFYYSFLDRETLIINHWLARSLFLQELCYSWTLKIEFKFFRNKHMNSLSFLRTSTATTSFRTKHLSTYCTQTDHFKTSITN